METKIKTSHRMMAAIEPQFSLRRNSFYDHKYDSGKIPSISEKSSPRKRKGKNARFTITDLNMNDYPSSSRHGSVFDEDPEFDDEGGTSQARLNKLLSPYNCQTETHRFMLFDDVKHPLSSKNSDESKDRWRFLTKFITNNDISKFRDVCFDLNNRCYKKKVCNVINV